MAVEFQFYLLSPWIVMLMHRGKAWIAPLAIFLISTFLNFYTLLHDCPDMTTSNPDLWIDYYSSDCYHSFTTFNYTSMPWRAAPYGFGMYCAYLYLYHKNLHSNIVVEWLVFICFIVIGYIGVLPFYNAKLLSPMLNTIWSAMGRSIYGLFLSYLIYFVLQDGEKEWYRPTRWMKWFLSLKMWLPVAMLSYSIYLLHLTVLLEVSKMKYGMSDEQRNMADGTGTGCPYSFGAALNRWGFLFLAGLFFSQLVALISYLVAEKPFIDARVAFKNKH